MRSGDKAQETEGRRSFSPCPLSSSPSFLRSKTYMKRAYGLLALVLLLVVGFRVVTLLTDRKDDKTLIQQALRQSLEASRKGEAGSALALLSESIRVNGEDQGGNRSGVAETIRKLKPDVTVANQNPLVTGDEATITSPVTLRASLPVFGDQALDLKQVTLTFRKETGHAYLVFPVTQWRLTGVTASPDAIASLGGFDAGIGGF